MNNRDYTYHLTEFWADTYWLYAAEVETSLTKEAPNTVLCDAIRDYLETMPTFEDE